MAQKIQKTDPKIRMARILDQLKNAYPDSQCSLHYRNPFELLVATVLSAQCTDERVNRVLPDLFKAYPDARSMARAPLPKLELLIRSTGFYKNKALSLQSMSRAVVAEYDGKVPNRLDALIRLRGVGRKTANVVLGNAYGIPGLVVDTHVGRLCRRMGFTRHQDPEKVEQDMMELVPKEDWTVFSHLLIDHGRRTCTARKPHCEGCVIEAECPKILEKRH